MDHLIKQLAEASRAMGFRDHVAPGNVVPHARSAQPAVASAYYKLTELLPKLPVSRGEHAAYAGEIDARQGATALTLHSAIMGNSRVAQAGAQLLVFSDKGRAVPGVPGALYAIEGDLRIVKPAPFAQVVDGLDVTTSDYPVASSHFEMNEAPSSAVRFEATRRAQKSMPEEQMAYEIGQSLAMGIAHEMDRILLNAIIRRTLSTFSYGAAAAKGVTFDQLRALVGTNGTGAAVNASGSLTAAGIPAELTDTVAATIVGTFNASAVAVMDTIHVLIERRDKAGTLAVTAYVNALPVLADSSLFWTVS